MSRHLFKGSESRARRDDALEALLAATAQAALMEQAAEAGNIPASNWEAAQEGVKALRDVYQREERAHLCTIIGGTLEWSQRLKGAPFILMTAGRGTGCIQWSQPNIVTFSSILAIVEER